MEILKKKIGICLVQTNDELYRVVHLDRDQMQFYTALTSDSRRLVANGIKSGTAELISSFNDFGVCWVS